MYNRRELKQKARQSLKKHYFIFVIVCLVAWFLGAGGGGSTSQAGRIAQPAQTSAELTGSGTSTLNTGFQGLLEGKSMEKLLGGLLESGLEKIGSSTEEFAGTTRGVFASVAKEISSGTLIETIVSAVVSMTGANSILPLLFILLSAVGLLLVWFYVANVYTAISARMFLEGRTYEEVPVHRFLYFYRIRKWTKVAFAMLRCTIYETLWWLTIVGGIIKYYSYRMVPYIVAENPGISSKEAIALSRKMMDGHKWECFVLNLTFIGWRILDAVTMGIVGKLYSEPYRQATFAEYYAYVRALAKEKFIEGSELLNDTYLFKKADRMDLLLAYEKEIDAIGEPKPPKKVRTGILGFIADVFGVTLVNDKTEQEYDEFMAKRDVYLSMRGEMSGKAYPVRLGQYQRKGKEKKFRGIYCERHYSIWSMIMLFFIFALIGWLWEVSLHLVSNGEFVNRGVLHGPWLPIYGTGGVLILVVLNKLRSKPLAEFCATIVLCGCVEYFTAWYLEATHDGQKWWDYSGYFLNLHGRICAEGLLVFGLGGMAIVYVAAPFLDNFLQKIKLQIIVPLCVALLTVFIADQIYSGKHPNTGKGITNSAAQLPEQFYSGQSVNTRC